MQIGDVVFAPLSRSRPYDLALARITGFQESMGTVSFEFLCESIGESSDLPCRIYRAPDLDPDSGSPTLATIVALDKVRTLLQAELQPSNSGSKQSSAMTNLLKSGGGDTMVNNSALSSVTSASPWATEQLQLLQQLLVVLPVSQVCELWSVLFSSLAAELHRQKKTVSASSTNDAHNSTRIFTIESWSAAFAMHATTALSLFAEVERQVMTSHGDDVVIDVDTEMTSSSGKTSTRADETGFLASISRNVRSRSLLHEALFFSPQQTSAGSSSNTVFNNNNSNNFSSSINSSSGATKLLSSALRLARTSTTTTTTNHGRTADGSKILAFVIVFADSASAANWTNFLGTTCGDGSNTIAVTSLGDLTVNDMFAGGNNNKKQSLMTLFVSSADDFVNVCLRGLSDSSNESSSSCSSSSSSLRNIVVIPGDDSAEVISAMAELEMSIVALHQHAREQHQVVTTTNSSSNSEVRKRNNSSCTTTTTTTIEPLVAVSSAISNSVTAFTDFFNNFINSSAAAGCSSPLSTNQQVTSFGAALSGAKKQSSTLVVAHRRKAAAAAAAVMIQSPSSSSSLAEELLSPHEDTSSAASPQQQDFVGVVSNMSLCNINCQGCEGIFFPSSSSSSSSSSSGAGLVAQFRRLISKTLCRWGCCPTACCPSIPCFPVSLRSCSPSSSSSSSFALDSSGNKLERAKFLSSVASTCFFSCPPGVSNRLRLVLVTLTLSEQQQPQQTTTASDGGASNNSISNECWSDFCSDTASAFIDWVRLAVRVPAGASEHLLYNEVTAAVLRLWLDGPVDGVVFATNNFGSKGNNINNNLFFSPNVVRNIGAFIQSYILSLNATSVASSVVSTSAASANNRENKKAPRHHQIRKLQPLVFVQIVDEQRSDAEPPQLPVSSVTAVERLLRHPNCVGNLSALSRKAVVSTPFRVSDPNSATIDVKQQQETPNSALKWLSSVWI